MGATGTPDRFARMAKVRAAMAEAGIDVLLCSLGADLPWLTGYEAMPLERLTMLVMPVDSTPTLVVPALEAPRVAAEGDLFEIEAWGETEEPISIVADLAGPASTAAISDRAWATHLLALQGAMPKARFIPASQVTSALRAVKDHHEIEALGAAARAADRVALALLAGEIPLIGRTEAEVSADLGRRLVAEGHSKVNFAIVGSGPNSASPHHEPSERRIRAGEAVVCDFGGTLSIDGGPGYCSDITRTVVTGEPRRAFTELYAVLEAAQEAGVEAARCGMSCETVDQAARAIIESAGYGAYFIHRTGHGIGLEEHEDPYLVEGNADQLVAGHAFSIEPGIYVPQHHGARIEDIVVATPEGPLRLNEADRSLTIVEA